MAYQVPDDLTTEEMRNWLIDRGKRHPMSVGFMTDEEVVNEFQRAYRSTETPMHIRSQELHQAAVESDKFRHQQKMRGFQNVADELARRNPVPSPLPEPPRTSNLMFEWPRVETWAMRFGVSRQQARMLIRQRFPEGATQQSAMQFLQHEFDIQGYGQARRTVIDADKQGFISEARWQRFPEHLKQRRMHQKHISGFKADDYGRYDLESEGYTRRRNEAYPFQINTMINSAPIGQVRQGDSVAYLTTSDRSKLLKRIQMWGAHEMVTLKGSGVTTPHRAPIRSGPASRRPETVQTMRAAMVVGGDPGPSGQFFFHRGAINEATKTIYKKIWGQWDQGDVAQAGAEFAPGAGLRLAKGLEPINVGHKAGHRVLDVAPISELDEESGERRFGYQFAIEQFTPTENALIRSKAFFQKGIGTTADLSGITDVHGNPLNVAMLGGLKDIGGYVYSHFAAKDINYLAKTLGMPVEQLRGKSYAELGEAPLQAFNRLLQSENSPLQTIHVPQKFTKAQLARLPKESLAINPSTGRPYAFTQKGDLYEAIVQYQALVGDVGMQASEDFPVSQPRLSSDEMAAMQRNDPWLAQQITGTRYHRRTQRAYRNVITAALASTGQGVMPSNALDASNPQVAKYVSRILGRAQSAAREALPDLPANAPIPKSVLQHYFMQQWEKSGRFINVPTRSGENIVLPPGRTLRQFRAVGEYENEEVARVVGHTYDVLAALAGGNARQIEKAAYAYRSAQMDIAGGEKTLIKAQSAFPTKSRMSGTVIRGAMELDPHEVYVPGMGGEAVHFMRFPTQGGQEYSINLRSLTREEIEARGLNPESMYAGMDVQQALAGDYDGDLDYAIRVGAVQVGQDGKLYAQNGQQLTSPSQLKQIAEKAKKQGAADLYGEMALTNPTSRKQALEQLSNTLANPHAMSKNDLVEELKTGQHRYGAIGPYYNTFVRGLATTPGHSRDAMQALFNVSHGITQRPQQLPAELQNLQDLMGFNLQTGGYFQKEKGEPGRLSAPTFNALRREVTRSLVNAKGDKGHFLSASEVAGLVGTPKTAGDITRAIETYRKDSTSRNFENIIAPLSTEEWLTGTGAGRMYGGYTTRQAFNKGMSIEDIANVDRIGLKAAGDLLGYGETQRQAILARQKPKNLVGYDEKEASLLERARAAGFEMKPQAQKEQARKRQYNRPEAGRLGTLTKDEIAAEFPQLTQAGGAAPPSDTPPFTRYPDDDDPFPKMPGDDKKRVFEGVVPPSSGGNNKGSWDWSEYNPPTITASKFAAVQTLREHLDRYSGDISRLYAQGRGVDPKNKTLRAVTSAAGKAADLERWMRQAHVIARKETGFQKELAEQFIEMGDPLLGPLNDDLRRAFYVDSYDSTFPGEYEGQLAQRKRGLALAHSGGKLAQIRSFQGAMNFGKAIGPGMIDEDVALGAADIEQSAFQYRLRHREYARLAGTHHEAMQAGQYGRARGIEKEMAPLAAEMKDLKNHISALKPEVKAHVEILKEERDLLKENVSQRKEELTQLQSRFAELNKQIRTEVGPKSPEKRTLQQERRSIREQIRDAQAEIASDTEGIGIRDAQMDILRKQGLKALPAAASIQKAPPSIWGQMGSDLKKGLSPQNMFYRSQFMAQAYYMLGMPLMRMRQEYLGAEFSRGRMEAALGMGGMPEDVRQLRIQEARGSNFREGVGYGVQQAVAPALNWLGELQESNENFAPTLGKWGTYALGAGAIGATLSWTGLGRTGARLIGAGAGRIGSLLGGSSISAAAANAGTYTSSGFLPAAAQTAGGAGLASGLMLGGSIAGGALVGVGVNEALAGQGFNLGDQFGGAFNKALQWTGSAMEYSGIMAAPGMLLRNIGEMRERQGVGGQFGFESLRKYWATMTGNVPEDMLKESDKPVPVEVRGFSEDIRRQFAEGLGGEVSDAQAAEILFAFAEATGQRKELRPGTQSWKQAQQFSQMGLDLGLNPEEVVGYVGKAPQAFGFGPGSSQTNRILQMFSGVQSIAELDSLFQAGQAVSPALQRTGLMGNLENVTRQYADIRRDQGDYYAQRYMQQMTAATTYDWSQQAYAAGLDNLALMDEQKPWQPKYQAEQWAIEDRRRRQDTNLQLGANWMMTADSGWQISGFSGGRQEQEIGWQQEKLDLEKDFWDFRMKKREEDYGLQLRQHDLTIKQMEYQLEKADEYAKLQETNFKKQMQLSIKLFDLQTKWQEEDFTKQEQRMDVTWGFQQQGMALSREGFELQTAWQQEDMQRALRYASGRQRIDIRRQMERAGVMSNLKRDQMALSEAQAITSHEWKEEDLATARERWGISRPLQREQMMAGYEYQSKMMELQEKDREKYKEFQQEAIQLQKDRHTNWLENYDIETRLITEQHDQEMQMAEQRLEWNKEDLQIARERALENETILEWQRQQTEAQQLYNAAAQVGLETVREWNLEVQQLVNHLNALAGGASGGSTEPTTVNWQQIATPAGPSAPVTASGGPGSAEWMAEEARLRERRDELLVEQNDLLKAMLDTLVAGLKKETDINIVIEDAFGNAMNHVYTVEGP